MANRKINFRHIVFMRDIDIHTRAREYICVYFSFICCWLFFPLCILYSCASNARNQFLPQSSFTHSHSRIANMLTLSHDISHQTQNSVIIDNHINWQVYTYARFSISFIAISKYRQYKHFFMAENLLILFFLLLYSLGMFAFFFVLFHCLVFVNHTHVWFQFKMIRIYFYGKRQMYTSHFINTHSIYDHFVNILSICRWRRFADEKREKKERSKERRGEKKPFAYCLASVRAWTIPYEK